MTINTDCYRSDEWVLDMFDNWFDPVPLNDNPEIDALEIEWKDKTFVNPPYSKPLPFIKKAIEENKKGKRVVIVELHGVRSTQFQGSWDEVFYVSIGIRYF